MNKLPTSDQKLFSEKKENKVRTVLEAEFKGYLERKSNPEKFERDLRFRIDETASEPAKPRSPGNR